MGLLMALHQNHDLEFCGKNKYTQMHVCVTPKDLKEKKKKKLVEILQ